MRPKQRPNYAGQPVAAAPAESLASAFASPQAVKLPITSEPPPADWVAVATVGAPIGLSGAVRLRTFDSFYGTQADEPILCQLKSCWLKLAAPGGLVVGREQAPSPSAQDRWIVSAIKSCAVQPRGLKLQLELITDRNQAEGLRGAEVGVSRSAFPAANEQEAYWADLIGCQVVNRQGQELGIVQSLQSNGEHDWLVLPAGWIPYVEAYVDRVDPKGRIIYADWNPEWFEL